MTLDDLAPAALLAAAKGDPDPERKREAQRRIVAASSLRTARTLFDGTDDDRLKLVDDLAPSGPVPFAILPVLLGALDRPTADGLREIYDRIRRHRARDLGVVGVGHVGDFVRERATVAGPRDVLEMVEWATDAGDGGFDEGEHVAPFVIAACAALDRVPDTKLDDFQFARGFGAVLAIGGGHAAPLVDRWLASDAACPVVARRLFDVHGQLQRHADDRRIVAVLAAAWDRARDRDVLARHLGAASNGNSGIAGRAWFADWAWEVFRDRPHERAAIYQAFRGWRDDFVERRNATERSRRPGGAGAIDHFEVWGPIDLDRMTQVIEESARLARGDEWPGLVDAIFGAVAALPATDYYLGLCAACRLGHEVSNRMRDGDDAPAPEIEAAAKRFVARAKAIVDHMHREGLVVDSLMASREDDLQTSIRLCERVWETRAERERDRVEREAAARRREDEVRRAHDEARRAQAEALRHQAELVAAMQARMGIGPNALPQLAGDPIDREIFFGHLALPTLLDYVRVMVRMSRGGDTLAIFADHGLDAGSWAACAQAWSGVLATRHELGLRFAALFAAPWG